MPNNFQKPRIVISQCLDFEPCRYNGKMVHDRVIDGLKSSVEFLPVCPEMACGLGVPRNPIRIVMMHAESCLFQPATNRNITQEMRVFVDSYLKLLSDVDGFILKSKSPSCGLGDVKIYHDGKPDTSFEWGSGLFAHTVTERFPGLPVIDEVRLKNTMARKHFLTAIFTLSRFRSVLKSRNIKMLIHFHEQHRDLLVPHCEKEFLQLWEITENHDQLQDDCAIQDYKAQLGLCLRKMLKPGPVIQRISGTG